MSTTNAKSLGALLIFLTLIGCDSYTTNSFGTLVIKTDKDGNTQ